MDLLRKEKASVSNGGFLQDQLKEAHAYG